MVFQWYLFPLLLFVAWFAKAAGQTYTVDVNGRTERRYGWTPVLMILIPLILLAGFRTDFSDTGMYRASFRNMPEAFGDFVEYFKNTTKDKGFSVFVYCIKSIIGNHDKLYFTIIAAICLLCVGSVYKKYSCNMIFSMFLFIASGDYIQWNYNGIRQFIAVSVIFASTKLLIQKKYLRYFFVILAMATIHASALIMIPFTLVVHGKPWNKRTVLFTAAVLLAINFSDGLRELIANLMEDTQYSGEVDQFLATKGTNIFRVLVFSIPPVMALIFRKSLLRAGNPVMNLATNMSIISMGAYIVSSVTSGIFIGRIPIYFSLYNYILLPWLIENVFERRSKIIIHIIIIVCYMYYYYYQMHVVWML